MAGTSYVAFDAANKVYGKAKKENLKLEDHRFVRYTFLFLVMKIHLTIIAV
jgi:hypothetical protein